MISMKRLMSVIMLFCLAFFLTGCDDPDKKFQDEKYLEAFNSYVERGGKNEIVMRSDDYTQDTRITYGNQAVHDYFYAGESQKKLGNSDLSKFYYKRAVNVNGELQIIPASMRLKEITEDFADMNSRVRSYQSRRGTSASDITNHRAHFEENLFSAPKTLFPDIGQIIGEYKKVSKALDDYFSLTVPNDGFTDKREYREAKAAFDTYARAADNFAAFLAGTKAQPSPEISTNPMLVSQAQSALGETSPTDGVDVNQPDGQPFSDK